MNIEKYLVLNKYLLSLFGVSDFKDFQEKLKDAQVGVDTNGRSRFINILCSSFEKLKISEDTLLGYDTNIQSYVKKINSYREPISLKYFQYLAVLFAEIVLDNLKNRKLDFLFELNEFLKTCKQKEDIKLIDEFSEKDLKKLAFWMATGSGKTLITHINYYQFFHYQLFSPDNIILITPNEGLSKQHFEELQKSGISSRLYAGSLNNLGMTDAREVLVIEMTKFVGEKKGGGVTLPVAAFEGSNLVFVDEGHKGKKSEEQKWATLRNKLAENGFVFEYSATFGQILSEKNKRILAEYAKSILFDYSYKYFYLDDYGKDFSVLNVKQTKISEQEFSEIMFVANLLSFYEQVLIFEENERLAREHNLEKPLWIFVGTTVTKQKEKEQPDVIQIVDFIKRVIQNEGWVKRWAGDILKGKTKLKDEEGKDVFSDRFKYLKKSREINFEKLYKKVFGGKGSFEIDQLKNAEGELGLKVGENEYFGVINIGNVPAFKKQLEEKGISVNQDVVSASLFDDIKKESSKINILIGSKKFIEGWDTWRVSSMGLLNIGRGQGPQIIQLFGRGIRLKGKEMSLKRSDLPAQVGEKNRVQFLEMLNIYGIRADYLNKFLEAIRKEGGEFVTIKIPVKEQHREKWKNLPIPSKNKEKDFKEEKILTLEIDDKIHFTIDLLPKLSMYLSKERKEGEEGITAREIKSEDEGWRFTEDIVDLLGWEKIERKICNFKTVKKYWNLVWDKDTLKNLLLSNRYRIKTLFEISEVKNGSDVRQAEDIALLVIKKYLELFYRKYANRFDTENLYSDTVEKQLPLSVFEKPDGKYYTVQIDKEKKELILKVKKLAKDLDRLFKKNSEELPRVYFDNHLYIPLLLQDKKIDKISPPGLMESEQKFVMGLRQHLKNNKDKFSNVELYLLRNFPKSGVGFQLEWAGFYPDFIMWLKNGKKEFIVFLDPKGLEHSKELANEKIQFAGFGDKNDHEIVTIKQVEKNLNKKAVILESFILSITSYKKLIEGRTKSPSKDEYINHHVLFLNDNDWPERLFRSLPLMT